MRKFLFTLALCYFFQNLYSQDLVSRPSPNNAVSTVSGEDLVNLYTGELNLNIPLFSLPTKESAVPVSLQYVAGGGVKVQDYASVVGLGWKLNAGGKITRVVRGYPDEHNNGYLGTEQWGMQLKNAVLANPSNPSYPSQLVPNINTMEVVKDSEADMYFIETPMFSAYFTFDASGNAVFLNESGLKVIPYNFYNTTNYTESRFVVVDPSGNQYYFALNGSREHSQYHEGDIPKLKDKSYVSCWYLDKIISGSRRDTIDFEYENFNPTPFELPFPVSIRILNTHEVYRQFSASRTSISSEPSSTQRNYKYHNTVLRIRSLYLKSIKSSMGKVDFNYVNDRQDSGAPRLSHISLFSRMVTGVYKDIRTFHYDYSYFGPPSSNNQYTRRLCLEGIRYTPYSSLGNPGSSRTYYTFGYNRRKNLPGRDSDQYDFFGYYTKSDTSFFSNAANPLDNTYAREPLFLEYASANILESFTNEFGMKQSVGYELKTISKQPYSIMPFRYANGVRVKEIVKSSGNESFRTSFKYDFPPLYGSQYVSSGEILADEYNVLEVQQADGNAVWTKILSHSEANLLTSLSPMVGYSKVQVINPDESNTLYEFTNFGDFPDRLFGSGSTVTYKGSFNVLSSISKSNKRGQPKRITYYNNDNMPIKSQEYVYSTIGAVLKNSYSLKNYVTSFVNKSQTRSAMYTYISLYWNETENYRLTKIIEKVYDSTLDEYILSGQDITYNSSPYSWQTRSVISTGAGGTQQKVTSYYPNDMSNIPLLESGELWNLDYIVADNILSPVVHQDNEIDGEKISGIHTCYTHPFKIGSTSGYAYQNGVANKVSESLYAYAQGNLALIENESQERSSMGYHNNLVNVKISNASALSTSPSSNKYYEFYYEGFEHLSTSNNYAGNGSTAVPFQVTFVKPNTRKYLIDYRYLDFSGKWIYVKSEYTNNMLLNPSGTRIDEVRIYPIDSQIETMTHEPLVGVTSETNSLGHTVFYEYDEQQRLKLVRDQDGNIVKTYCYNQKGQQVDCNSLKVYLSSVVSARFYRKGCSTGLYGSEVWYTVPAGMFSSTISQADANSQAYVYLSAQGQEHANTHGECLPEGTYVTLCDEGSRTVIDGNYHEIYTTYRINVYKTPYGRFYKQSPVDVTFSYRGGNTVFSVTGSYLVGERLSLRTYIPPHPNPNEDGEELNYTPDIAYSPNYQIISVPCGDEEEEEEENEEEDFVDGQTYNMVYFQTQDALCNYTSDMDIGTTTVYYYGDPQSEAHFFTGSSMQSVVSDGYYTFYKAVDHGPNKWYKMENGIMTESGICQQNQEEEEEEEFSGFVQGHTYDMVHFQFLSALCSYTADTDMDIMAVHYYDDPQSEAKFFSGAGSQHVIADGYYTFYKAVDHGPNKWFRIEGGIIIDSGICGEEEPEEEVFAQGQTYNMVLFGNLYALCGYTADMDMDSMEVYYYDDPQSEAKFFSDSSRQYVPEDGYYTFYKIANNGPNRWYKIEAGVIVESGICQ